MVIRLSLLYMTNTCRNDLDFWFDTIVRSYGVESRAIKMLGRVVRRAYRCGYQQEGMSV